MRNKVVIGINLFITFLILITFFYLSKLDPILIERSIYDFIHISIESIISMISFAVFYIGWYSFPYEKRQKYVIPSSIFFSIALINILHIYFAIERNSWGISIVFANMTYMLLGISIILLNTIPDSHLAKNRRHFFYIPLIFTTSSLVFYLLIKNSSYSTFLNYTKENFMFYRLMDLAVFIYYFFALMFSSKNYIINPDIQNISSMNSIMFAIISKYIIVFHIYPNDIFSTSAHLFKFISFLFLVKTFIMSNIKKPYEELNQANNIKTDFLINLSHELRTPVNVILNASKLICKNPQEYAKYISSIENNAYRLNKISENLIIYNEIENGNIDTEYTDEDIVYIIDEIIEMAEDVLDKKCLDVSFEFSNKRNFVTDKRLFTQIVLNLISNSIKYADYGGNICIKLDIADSLKLTILNDGPPISEEEKHKIFEKFYKSKNTKLPTTEGLGIGLYIAKEFTKMLNGDIHIVNKNNMTGYTLIIRNAKNVKILDQYRKVEYSEKYFADII
ncbi:MAG: two-component sensor histidine kinase [Caloramator sp.]|uniref:sensor histidine kinase n=1 Tax=Caloramator sp. TaxID=1871330 RepID=UPI001D9F17E3|nr:ATP-binding protein [Caloramator sp.]MBZ4664402.1 two-component sensor histidine kinase [Caloramator sp.]